MKTVSKLVVLLSLGALVPVTAFAATTPEQTYLETCRKEPGVPVPITVVSPTVASDNAGATVQLEFVVNENGHPVNFSVKSSPDSALAETVVSAVKRWRFKPAERDGVPVATKVALPVTIVEPAVANGRYAMK